MLETSLTDFVEDRKHDDVLLFHLPHLGAQAADVPLLALLRT